MRKEDLRLPDVEAGTHKVLPSFINGVGPGSPRSKRAVPYTMTFVQILSVVGVFGWYSSSAYMQEKLYSVEGYSFGFYLTLVRFLVNIILSFLHLHALNFYYKKNIPFPFASLFRDLLAASSSTHSSHSLLYNRATTEPDPSPAAPIPQPFALLGAHQRVSPKKHEEVRVQMDGISPTSTTPTPFSQDDSSSADEDNGKGILKRKPAVPMYFYAFLSIFSVFSLGFSSSSLDYLSYPTKIVIKSSKIVVIMIAGIFIIRKRYTLAEYLLVFCTLLGLATFTVGDATASSATDPTTLVWEIIPSSVPDSFGATFSKGLAILALSMASEAIVVNYQKKLLESHRTSPVELLFYTSVFGSVFLFIIVTVFTSELFHALDFLVDHPECNLYAVLFSVFGYGGMFSVLTLLEDFSPMFVGLVVVSKTALTVVSSFFLFPKPLTILHIVGCMLVFGSLFGHVLIKHR